MNKAFINTDVWKDDELFVLPIEAKLLYFFLISGPDRNYINVFKFNRRLVAMIMGVTDRQFDVALKALTDTDFVEVYEGYIGILKSHATELNGYYNKINADREYEKLPDEIRQHFYPDGREVIVNPKPAKKSKPGPKAETVNSIIAEQHPKIQEALKEFVEDRKERKRPPTTRAVKGWLNKLHTMYPNDHDKQSQSLYQSIERGWNGVFEVKDDRRESAFL